MSLTKRNQIKGDLKNQAMFIKMFDLFLINLLKRQKKAWYLNLPDF